MSRVMSAAEFLALQGKGKKRSKYGVAAPEARTWNGKTYASKAEMMRMQGLSIDPRILAVIEQPRFYLGVRENVYVADGLVIPKSGTPWVEDIKGVETQQFKKIKKLWAAYGRLPLHILTLKRDVFEVVEIIEPRNRK